MPSYSLGKLYGDADYVDERHRHRFEVCFLGKAVCICLYLCLCVSVSIYVSVSVEGGWSVGLFVTYWIVPCRSIQT